MADITEPLQTDQLETADSVTQSANVLATDQVDTADSVTQSISVLATDQVDTADSISSGVNSSLLTDSLNVVDDATGASTVVEPLLTDTLQTADAVSDAIGENVVDQVQTADSAVAQVEVNELLIDQVAAEDDGPPLWLDSITDQVQAVDSSTPRISDWVSDSVQTADAVPAWQLTESITDQVATADSVDDTNRVEALITDRVQTADSLSDERAVTEVMTDTLQALDQVTQFADLLEQARDSVIVVDRVFDAGAVIIESITDTVYAVDAIYSPDANALAWVVNTETGAPYYFTNYGFTDIVEHSGMLFGAAPDGLYLLEGDDDEGVDIDATLTTGFLTLGTSHKKRLPDIYFGYTGGELECDVETYDQPNDVYTYGMDARDADAPRNNRIQLGKGLESRYWRLTLRNLAGSAFQIYDTVANVVASKRRL